LLIPLGVPLLDALRLLDSGICAQVPTHMLAPGGVTLPLCARNTGIYSGAALAFGILRARGRQRAMLPPPPWLIAVLLALIALMGLDGLNSVAADLALPHLYAPTNALRLASGLGAGVALVLLLAPVIARARYGAADQRPPVEHAADLLRHLGAALVAYLLIWSTASWTLYPVALLSNAGLLAVLIGVNRIALRAIRGVAGMGQSPLANNPVAPASLMLVAISELALLAGMRLALLGPAGIGA
jgi:uncharacterized membrane protein